LDGHHGRCRFTSKEDRKSQGDDEVSVNETTRLRMIADTSYRHTNPNTIGFLRRDKKHDIDAFWGSLTISP
jgi:hypothetical protein